MLEIVVDCLFESFLERPRWFPAEVCKFVKLKCIPLVVTSSILDEGDLVLGPADSFENRLGHFEIGSFFTGANIVDFAGSALTEYEIKRPTVVLNIDPLANVRPVTVYGEFFACSSILDELRDEFLRMLPWAEVVTGTRVS